MNDTTRIPMEIEPETQTSDWWRPIAIAVSIAVFANVALMGLGISHTKRSEELLLQSKWALATDPSHSFEWIVVGDSSGMMGVDPSLMSSRLSASCVNLCTFGSMGIAGDLWSVEQYLKSHSPPRGVILVHAANVWAGKQSDALFQYSAAIPESTPKLLSRVISLGARPSELFVLLRYRDYFPVTMLKEMFQHQSGWSNDVAKNTLTEIELAPNGEFRLSVEQANPDQVLEETNRYLASIREVPRLDWHNRLALKRLIELARENQFSLFIANGPIASTVRNNSQFDDSMSSVISELATLASQNPPLISVSRKWFEFLPQQMESCNHIVGPAVDVYTNNLADEILNSLLQNHSEIRNGDAGKPAPL